MTARIVLLPGDGIGPEVTTAARLCLEAIAECFDLSLELQAFPFGGAAIDECSDPFPEETRKACKAADAVFLGAVGGPKWDNAKQRPEAGLLALRKELGAFANLRPIQIFPGLEHLSPIKPDRLEGVDLLIVRELTGGIYFGAREEGIEQARDQCSYTKDEIERVARTAFDAARSRRSKLTSVDKANVLATSRLWRSVVSNLQKTEYPDVALDHMLVDAMAMRLIQTPASFDVVLTENMFGDILSDEASVLAGSIGLAPSSSIGNGVGLYEPIHGSAPDIAGQDKANPVGAILSAAMLLRHSLGHEDASQALELAVLEVLASGERTADLGGLESCSALTDKVVGAIKGRRPGKNRLLVSMTG